MSEPMSLSPADAAQYIGLSVPTVYRLLSSGAIKGKRSGARTLINGPSLRAFYAALPDYQSRPMANSPQVTKPPRKRRAARS